MKKTFTINISGSVFHIDEDAYEKLQNYLQMLSAHFGPSAEGREILQDIEARIAELFNERMQSQEKDVIIEEWVDEVIARMGKPEDFFGEEEEDEPTQEKTTQEPTTKKTKRRMYRDADHRVFAGICSGMGAYFNIDPVILRVLFVVIFLFGNLVAFSGSAMLLIYLLLWIAVPKARTTAQRLEMRGQEATVSNIEKSIKEEVKEVKESYKRFKDSDSYSKGKDQMSRFGDVLASVLKVILKVLVVIFGACLIVTGFVGLVGFITSMAIGHSVIESAPWFNGYLPNIHAPALANFFINPASLTILSIAVSLFVGIPLLLILFIGAKLIFRFKTNNKLIFLASFGVWLVSLVIIIVVSASQLSDYSKKTSINESHVVDCQDCTTLYLELADDPYQWNNVYEFDLNRMKVITENGKTILLGEPQLDVERSSTDDFVVLIRKKARGKNQENAKDHVDEISYTFNQKDSTLYFNPYFKLEEGDRWLDQEVDITIKVPEGKSVYLGEDLVKIIYDIENVSNTWDGDMIGKYWKMTDLGLEEDKTR